MSNQRFESSPRFVVENDPVVIEQAPTSTANLLVFKNSNGDVVSSIDSSGAVVTDIPSTFAELEVTDTLTVPTGTTFNSPNLTGVPVAPTAAGGTNTTQLATTEFVRGEIANLVASSPSTLDTLDELANALGDDPNFATTVTNSLATKAPLASPALTGTPTAPTAATGTNTTQISTTQFVQQELAVFMPPGVIVPYGGSTSPTGWLICSGQEVAIASYGALYAIIGTTFGSLTDGAGGVGTTHFRLPDLRGRVIAGADNMGGTAANRLTLATSGITSTTVGAAGGDERLHQHQHANTASFTGSAVTSGAGSAHRHNNTLTNNAVNSGGHSADHSHSGTTNNDSPDHTHGPGTESRFVTNNTTTVGGLPAGNAVYNPYNVATSTGGASARHQHTFSTGGASVNHTHSVTSNVTISNVDESAHTHSVTAAGTVAMTNANQGFGTAQNVQPTMILNYIIKT